MNNSVVQFDYHIDLDYTVEPFYYFQLNWEIITE